MYVLGRNVVKLVKFHQVLKEKLQIHNKYEFDRIQNGWTKWMTTKTQDEHKRS
jgi:hypothetical protein